MILFFRFGSNRKNHSRTPGFFTPKNKEFQAPYIPPDSTVHKFHRPPSIEKMQDGRVARGDFPAKAEIIAQKDIFSTYFYYLSIQNVGKPHIFP